MGTVLIEISWARSGRAVSRKSADRANAPGTVIGHLARDKRNAFKWGYPAGRARVTRRGGPSGHSCVVWLPQVNLAVLKTGPDRDPLARDHRTVASCPAPEQPAQQAPGARPGRDAHSGGRDPLFVPA